MKKCLEVTEGLEKQQFQRLGVKERLEVRLHLRICPKCREYARDSVILNRMIRRSMQHIPQIQFTDEEKRELIARLRS